jgi:hypothetical protein
MLRAVEELLAELEAESPVDPGTLELLRRLRDNLLNELSRL